MNELIQHYWNRFLKETNRDKDTKFVSCDHFELNEALANQLLELVLCGKKKATASSYLSYERLNLPLPKVGDLNIVTSWNNTPRCVVETTSITYIPFKEMTYDICKKEGEDDNLESWRKGHTKFFTLEGQQLGYSFSPDMLVIFEEFKVIFK